MTRTPSRHAPRLSDLATVDDRSKCINVVIETSKGGRTKLAYDPEREAFAVKRLLPQGLGFPFDFGFIPSTLGEDGDPLVRGRYGRKHAQKSVKAGRRRYARHKR